MAPSKDRSRIVRYIYLYLVTAISIVLIIIASIGLIDLVLEEYVFDVPSYQELEPFYECGETGELFVPKIEGVEEQVQLMQEELEECKKEAKERRASKHANDVKRTLINWISMLLVAVPIYLYHWGLIRKESKK